MDGKTLIKQFEGCKLIAYKCPAGIWTIGYGHTNGVKEGDKISQEQADKFLEDDYKEAESQVKKVVQVPLTVNQLGALTSFVFNLGIRNLTTSSLLKRTNQKDYQGASEEFMKWIYCNKIPSTGLVRRREAERNLFLT